jgi:sRNA-binding protein
MSCLSDDQITSEEGVVYADILELNQSVTDKLAQLMPHCAPREARFKRFEKYIPPNAVTLLDNEKRFQAKAFRAWIALYRLRQRYLRGVAHELAVHIAGRHSGGVCGAPAPVI